MPPMVLFCTTLRTDISGHMTMQHRGITPSLRFVVILPLCIIKVLVLCRTILLRILCLYRQMSKGALGNYIHYPGMAVEKLWQMLNVVLVPLQYSSLVIVSLYWIKQPIQLSYGICVGILQRKFHLHYPQQKGSFMLVLACCWYVLKTRLRSLMCSNVR